MVIWPILGEVRSSCPAFGTCGRPVPRSTTHYLTLMPSTRLLWRLAPAWPLRIFLCTVDPTCTPVSRIPIRCPLLGISNHVVQPVTSRLSATHRQCLTFPRRGFLLHHTAAAAPLTHDHRATTISLLGAPRKQLTLRTTSSFFPLGFGGESFSLHLTVLIRIVPGHPNHRLVWRIVVVIGRSRPSTLADLRTCLIGAEGNLGLVHVKRRHDQRLDGSMIRLFSRNPSHLALTTCARFF